MATDPLAAHIETSIHSAERAISKLTKVQLGMVGLSGIKTRHFYNNLCNFENSRCLYLGVRCPSIIFAAICGNSATICIVEHFATPTFNEFYTVVMQNRGACNISIYNMSPLDMEISADSKFNTICYSGDVSNITTTLLKAMPYCDSTFIYVIEQWNFAAVREAVFKAFQSLSLNVIWGRDVRLTNNDTHTPLRDAKISWWNGIGVFAVQKQSPIIHILSHVLAHNTPQTELQPSEFTTLDDLPPSEEFGKFLAATISQNPPQSEVVATQQPEVVAATTPVEVVAATTPVEVAPQLPVRRGAVKQKKTKK